MGRATAAPGVAAVSDLDCCGATNHVREEGDGEVRYRCASCGTWWSMDEYNRLVLEERERELEEADWYDYDEYDGFACLAFDDPVDAEQFLALVAEANRRPS